MSGATNAGPPDLADYRRQVRNWLEENLERRQEDQRSHDADYYTPEVLAENRALQRRLFEAGYAGITWPIEFGGQGLPSEYEWAFLEEAADFVTPDFGLLSNTTFHTCVPTMIAHAPSEFLRWFVPIVLAGDALVCQFFSEPSAGSDLAAARTRARPDGDQWIIDGQKTWSSYAHRADWGMVLARTDWDVPKHRGLTWFAVPCDAAGLTIRPIRQVNGTTEFCEEFFDSVVVPDDWRISPLNEGWAEAQTMLVYERGAGGASSGVPLAGPGPIAPDLVSLAKDGIGLADPNVRQKLARVHMLDFVGRSLAYRVSQLDRLGQLNPGIAAYVKLYRGTFDPIRARLGLEVGGPMAVSWSTDERREPAAALAYLNGRQLSIAGGTNEMQRNAIAERALGMPREPSIDASVPFTDALRNAGRWPHTI